MPTTVQSLCPHCKRANMLPINKGRFLYGSPLKLCRFCMTPYVDKLFYEPALVLESSDRPAKVRLGNLVGIVLGALIILSPDFLPGADPSVAALGAMICAYNVGAILVRLLRYPMVVEKRDLMMRSSRIRLSDPDYARKLKDAGYDVPSRYLADPKAGSGLSGPDRDAGTPGSAQDLPDRLRAALQRFSANDPFIDEVIVEEVLRRANHPIFRKEDAFRPYMPTVPGPVDLPSSMGDPWVDASPDALYRKALDMLSKSAYDRKAISFLEAAAQRGSADAQDRLARILTDPECPIYDLYYGFRWLDKAIDLNQPDALWYYAYLYMNGLYLEKNTSKSLPYVLKTAVFGNSMARRMMDQVKASFAEKR